MENPDGNIKCCARCQVSARYGWNTICKDCILAEGWYCEGDFLLGFSHYRDGKNIGSTPGSLEEDRKEGMAYKLGRKGYAFAIYAPYYQIARYGTVSSKHSSRDYIYPLAERGFFEEVTVFFARSGSVIKERIEELEALVVIDTMARPK